MLSAGELFVSAPVIPAESGQQLLLSAEGQLTQLQNRFGSVGPPQNTDGASAPDNVKLFRLVDGIGKTQIIRVGVAWV